MPFVYAPPHGSDSRDLVRERLERSGAFDVRVSGVAVRATRRRRVPSRGLLRLLLPRTVVVLRAIDGWTVRPDGLAIGALVVMLGGIVVELAMDRARYPREYPPEFVYGLTLAYGLLLALEIRTTRRAVQRALADGPSRG